MNRREFVAGLWSAAAWPLAGRAQQAAVPVVGFLNTFSATWFAPMVAGFRRGLRSVGYAEGRNLAVEFRWAENQLDRLPALAADLVDKRVSVIAATGNEQTVLAVKAATADIPIVFTSGSDPVRLGVVASFSRPGGNATGVNMMIREIEGKRLGLLHELVPAATRIAAILDPSNVDSDIVLTGRPPCSPSPTR
jgi:putative tryptophan/tyrosine transport system substrate-binding protein